MVSVSSAGEQSAYWSRADKNIRSILSKARRVRNTRSHLFVQPACTIRRRSRREAQWPHGTCHPCAGDEQLRRQRTEPRTVDVTALDHTGRTSRPKRSSSMQPSRRSRPPAASPLEASCASSSSSASRSAAAASWTATIRLGSRREWSRPARCKPKWSSSPHRERSPPTCPVSWAPTAAHSSSVPTGSRSPGGRRQSDDRVSDRPAPPRRHRRRTPDRPSSPPHRAPDPARRAGGRTDHDGVQGVLRPPTRGGARSGAESVTARA
jgi:hypothetical protein